VHLITSTEVGRLSRRRGPQPYENIFSQQNVDQQKRLCCYALRVCDWCTDLSLIAKHSLCSVVRKYFFLTTDDPFGANYDLYI
jgi:hypothetical protein